MVENEAATAVCRKLLRLERPSHDDLNKVICNSLVGALVPTAAAASPAPAARGSGREAGGTIVFCFVFFSSRHLFFDSFFRVFGGGGGIAVGCLFQTAAPVPLDTRWRERWRGDRR